MAISIKAEPINRDIALMLDQSFSPEAQSAAFAEFAAEQIEQAKQTDAGILGRVPAVKIVVDGREGAPLQSVKPDGIVVAEFDLFNDVLAWIADQLETHSPIGSRDDPHPGLYQKSHTLFADGQEVDVGTVLPTASEFVFLNTQPYAHKIETGSSSQAPDGVYQAVAMLASRRFGNIAKITFSYRAPLGGTFMTARQGGNKTENRQPAIIVNLGDR